MTHSEDDGGVRKEVTILGGKPLPKQLATEMPDAVTQIKPKDSQDKPKIVNAIWVDDDPMVTDLPCQLLFPLIIDVYRTPAELMSRVEPNCIYSKNTPIFLDYNFDNAPNITGVDVAKKLFELGFTKLRLLSGQDLEASGVEIPDYLMILPKSAAANLDKYF